MWLLWELLKNGRFHLRGWGDGSGDLHLPPHKQIISSPALRSILQPMLVRPLLWRVRPGPLASDSTSSVYRLKNHRVALWKPEEQTLCIALPEAKQGSTSQGSALPNSLPGLCFLQAHNPPRSCYNLYLMCKHSTEGCVEAGSKHLCSLYLGAGWGGMYWLTIACYSRGVKGGKERERRNL